MATRVRERDELRAQLAERDALIGSLEQELVRVVRVVVVRA